MMFKDKVKSYILENKLLDYNENIVIGVSGGADSICLMHVLLEIDLSLNISIATLNHGIREESDEEVEYVKDLCTKYSLPFYTQKIKILKDKKTRLEEEARKIRYKFLEDIAKRVKAKKVVVAHHLDDNIETILMNFLKGTGLYGLCGIIPIRPINYGSDIKLVRPLLCVSKQEILNYLNSINLKWYEDKTNKDVKYTRNNIRNNIIPFLKNNGYPLLEKAMLHTSKRVCEIIRFIEDEIEKKWDKIIYKRWAPLSLERYFEIIYNINPVIKFKLDEIKEISSIFYPYILRKVISIFKIRDILLQEIHYKSFNDILTLDKGSIFLPNNIKIIKTLKNLYIVYDKNINLLQNNTEIAFYDNEKKVKIKDNIYIYLEHFKLNKLEKKDNIFNNKDNLNIFIDKNKVKFPLKIRKIKEGDKIFPLGAKGKKKISKLLIDLKIPKVLRKNILIITDKSDEIIWVIGICISEKFKINSYTQEILNLKLLEIKKDEED